MRLFTALTHHSKVLFFIALFVFDTCTTFAQTPFKGGSGKMKKLVWSDEFDYQGLPDSSKWSYDTGYLRNQELQFYTSSRAANAIVQNGRLTITARLDSLRKDGNVYPITSASVTTKNRQSWTYGRVEVNAKIPSSLGTWPAIWMLGTNIDSADWPLCGEIDIMEHVGYMPDTVHFNVHTQKYNHAIGTGKGKRLGYKKAYEKFHVYAIEWFPDHIDWYMDDRKVFSYANERTGKGAWPFDEPQYLLLNLAFGGAWGGQKGVNVKALPQTFEIEYVRVYQ